MEKAKNLKVLVVEDDALALENTVEFLEDFFEQIYVAKDAFEATKIYNQNQLDIIITDINMPKLSGLEFISNIRKKDKKVQIIVLSAYSNKEYLFKAIELGLVKYLVKPIEYKAFKEALELCIESIAKDYSNIITLSNGYIFDTYNKTLVLNDEIIKLRTKELALLALLVKNKNRYVTYDEIEHLIWTDSVMTKDALKTLVKNLKSKITNNIINLSGTGYKLEF